MPNYRQTRLAEIAAIAVDQEDLTGLPAKLLIAQWAVESNWGAKPVGNANYFGIKKSKRHTLCCSAQTQEVINGKRQTQTLEFADYPSLLDSCLDYIWLITRGAPYSKAWADYKIDKDFSSFANRVLAIYATAQYGTLALQIANQPNVLAAIEVARANRIIPSKTT